MGAVPIVETPVPVPPAIPAWLALLFAAVLMGSMAGAYTGSASPATEPPREDLKQLVLQTQSCRISIHGVTTGHPRGIIVRASIDSVAETRDFKPDQWLSASKDIWAKLCSV